MRLLVLLVFVAILRPAVADDPASAAAPDPVDLVKGLKTRADQWWTARKRAAVPCTICDGRGRILWARSGWRECTGCRGGGKMYTKKNWQLLLYDMRSPAFRALPDARERAEQEYLNADSGKGARIITSFKIHRIQLVDLVHGIAWIIDNKDTTARPQHWIWMQDPTTEKYDWWLYEKQVDGPWPPVPPDAGFAGVTVIPEAQAAPLAKAIEDATPRSTVRKLEALGGALVVTLSPLTGPNPETMTKERFQAMALSEMRMSGKAIWATPGPWTSVRWVFQAPWRDKFGQVADAQWLSAWIRRDWFERIVWTNLDLEERAELFDLEWARYDDRIPWWKG